MQSCRVFLILIIPLPVSISCLFLTLLSVYSLCHFFFRWGGGVGVGAFCFSFPLLRSKLERKVNLFGIFTVVCMVCAWVCVCLLCADTCGCFHVIYSMLCAVGLTNRNKKSQEPPLTQAKEEGDHEQTTQQRK